MSKYTTRNGKYLAPNRAGQIQKSKNRRIKTSKTTINQTIALHYRLKAEIEYIEELSEKKNSLDKEISLIPLSKFKYKYVQRIIDRRNELIVTINKLKLQLGDEHD